MPRHFRRGRRYGRRGRGRRSSGWMSRVGRGVGLAMKAWRMAKYIKGLVNVERKFLDVVQTPASVGNVGSVAWLSSISQGSDYNQRNGISVKASSIQIRGTVQISATVNNEGQYMRIVLFQDKEDTAPAYSDLMETSSVTSPLNHINGSRFTILKDSLIPVSAAGTTSKSFNWFIKLGSHIKWSNSTTGIREGHIYLALVSDGAVAATQPVIQYYSRLRYVDN